LYRGWFGTPDIFVAHFVSDAHISKLNELVTD
jgi:hypothetical protein